MGTGARMFDELGSECCTELWREFGWRVGENGLPSVMEIPEEMVTVLPGIMAELKGELLSETVE